MRRISFSALLAAVLFPLPASAEVLLTSFSFQTAFSYASEFDEAPSSLGMKFGGTSYEFLGFPLHVNPVIDYTLSDPPWLAPIAFTFDPHIEDVTSRIDSGVQFEELSAAFSTSKYVTEDALSFEPSPYNDVFPPVASGLPISSIWGSTGFIPPNGVSLEGTPYTLSAVEFKVNSLLAQPVYESLGDFDYIFNMQYAVGFTVSLYGQVPEPATGMLVLSIGMLFPMRVIRR